MTGRRLLSPLGLRLAVAFVAVAVAAVTVLVGLTLVSARNEVSDLVTEVHAEDADAVADATAAAFTRAGGWEEADLSSAAAIAARGQAELSIHDASGRLIAAPAAEAAEMMARMHGVEILDVPRADPVRAPVVVDGEIVGTVDLRFPSSHLPGPERQIREALSRNALLGAGLAIASAVAVAVVVARVVSRPLNALTAAAADLEAGHRDVRVNLGEAPGELGTLAAAFDRMADAVEREDELRRQLVADVAHEVRTPLTILRGTTEALVDGVVEPDRSTLESLHEEVLRLTHLVGDLEILAAADAAGLHLDLELVDVSRVVAAVTELARPAAEAAELTVETSLDAAPALADEQRLRQVVTTLLANSIAYTPTGGTIALRTGTHVGGAVLEVSDTGPGITPDDLPHVFERFYRGRAAGDVQGSGIGLAIARELVEAHGGSITAGNRPEGGASFVVSLPAR